MLIPVNGGSAPAWLIPPDQAAQGPTWAIHVHGIRTTRITALRTVPAAQQAGITSLVISYRGDGEGPATPHNASSLGQTEWHDVDAAIDYALHHGAERVVLIGWSMGASPVLLAAERSAHRNSLAGLVLISPVTDWFAAIRAGARRAHLPVGLGSLGAAILASRTFCRLVGLSNPIDLHELTWTGSARVHMPCLVIHSDGDQEIPVEATRRFVTANPSTVELTEIGGAAHAWEYNLDPDRFDRTVVNWLQRHLSEPRDEGGGVR